MINHVFWMPLQARLRLAAKARIIRWVKPKTKRFDRAAPQFLVDEWSKGNKGAIADLYSRSNFDQDRGDNSNPLFHASVWSIEWWCKHMFFWQNISLYAWYAVWLGRVSEPVENSGEQEAARGTDGRWGLVLRSGAQRWFGLVPVPSPELVYFKVSTFK